MQCKDTLMSCIACPGCIPENNQPKLPKKPLFNYSPIIKPTKQNINCYLIHLQLVYEEFILKKKLITSMCPAVVGYAERQYHHILPYLSEVMNVNQMIEKNFINKEDYVNKNENSNMELISIAPCYDTIHESKHVLTPKMIINDEFYYEYIKQHNNEFLNYINKEANNKKYDEIDYDEVINKFIGFNYCEYIIAKLNEKYEINVKNNSIIEIKTEKYLFVKIFGLENMLNLFKSKDIHYNFVELFVCKGGCYNGPGLIDKKKLLFDFDGFKSNVEYFRNLKSVYVDEFFKEKRIFKKRELKRINYAVEW